MTRPDTTHRTIFCGGTVFDGTGAPPAVADIAVVDGWIAEVGLGLEGDVGTIEPGKRADLVRFAGTELDVSDLRRRVRAVHQDGALVSGG